MKQISYPALLQKTEALAKRILVKAGAISLVPVKTCWRCGCRMKKTNRGQHAVRCSAKKRKAEVRRSDVAWTPLCHHARGTKDGTVSYKELLKAAYVTGMKTPTDAAQHYLASGYDHAENMLMMMKHVAAFAEFYDGQHVSFAPGVVEADATKTNKANVKKGEIKHCGRFVITVHRETGVCALTPLEDKVVRRGAPPPPETNEEVIKALRTLKKDEHQLATDSAPAYKAWAKKSKAHHITVVHKTKSFVKVCRIPVKDLPPKLQQCLSKSTTPGKRVARVKAGDNMAEITFSVIKRNIARLNCQRSTTHATVNFLAGAWLHKHCGLDGILQALKMYREWASGNVEPRESCRTMSWLRDLEPLA